jgi:hypothetical protein
LSVGAKGTVRVSEAKWLEAIISFFLSFEDPPIRNLKLKLANFSGFPVLHHLKVSRASALKPPVPGSIRLAFFQPLGINAAW